MKEQKADHHSSANTIHCDINNFFKKEKYNMSKRILSLFTVLALCLTLLPAAVFAEDGEGNIISGSSIGESGEGGGVLAPSGGTAGQTEHAGHPICGDASCTKEEHKLPDNAEWVGVSTLSKNMAGGYYYLTDDVVLTSIWNPQNSITLCLNGHSITPNSYASVIEVTKDKTVTLCDCDTQGRGVVNANYLDGRGVFMNEGTLVLYSGKITGTKYGVYMSQDNSTFNMYGGTITGSGIGVYMYVSKDNNAFNMYGGTITGNGTSNDETGGVYVAGGKFKMLGGSISGNKLGEKSIGSGGVHVAGSGSFEMSGDAVISDNSITIREGNNYYPSAGAGGVYVAKGTFKMSGNAKIIGNTVTNTSSRDVSGGVYVDTKGNMTVSGNASVSDNIGGNVYLTSGKAITVDGELGETAAIGVRTPAIADGSSATVATGAKETDLNRFSDDSGKNYTKKYENGNILFVSTVSVCDHGGKNGFTFEYTSPDDLTASANCPYCGASAVAGAELKDGEGFRWRKFVNLQDAFDAVRDGGSTLYLLADVSGDYTIDGTQNTGLDLNGHRITGTLSVKGVKGDRITTTLSNTKNTTTVSVDKVVAFDGAELAGSGCPAVIGELTLADGATWENILNLKTLGYKVLNTDGSYKWYAQNDVTDTKLNNVIINSLPITSKNLSFKVDGTNVKGNKVERGTTVQLCASCNTSGATVTFYVKEPGNDGYTQHTSEYKKISSTWYYIAEYSFDKIGTYDIYFTATKDGYSVTSNRKKLTVNKASIPAGEITAPTANSLTYNGGEQNLIAEGTTTIGTMQYKLGKDGEWSAEIPKATNAGSYDVYYRVLGNENYNDTKEQKIECEIKKRSVSISNKDYKTEYMYGDIIQEPKQSNFEITGSEGNPNVSFQWIGEKPQSFSKIGSYTLKVTVDATANTAGGSQEITVTIARNTGDSGYNSGFDYMVYNNAGTVSYEIDFVDGVDSHATMIDRESLKLKGFIIVVRDDNGNYNPYDEDTCDFKAAITDGAEKGTVRVTLTDLNRTKTGYSFCMITIQAENEQYANIDIQLRLKIEDKAQKTLDVTMNSFTYGDNAGTPSYAKPEGTLETNVTYATKDGTPLAEAPTAAGEYTVTVVCETKDTTYSGSADYIINPKPISDVDSYLDKTGFTYNGNEQKPAVTVKMNDTGLVENTDYTVTYPTDMADVGTKDIKIKGIGNFSGEKTVSYQINKATVKVKPKDISKVYGSEPKFKLESESDLITADELDKAAESAAFTSGGAAKIAPVTADGYIISVQLLGTYEPKNLILEVDGTGKLTVEKADLTITVKDVSREYGAANPALEVTYSGFVNGENESDLNGEPVLKYDESRINEQTAVGLYTKATTAEGLTSDNYNINYVKGNVNITKIKVNASAGTAGRSYLSAVFDKSLAGLMPENFIVKDSEGNIVTVTNITASSDGKTYTLSGNFEVGREYTVKVVLSGAAADATYQLATDEFVITPIHTSSGGGGTTRYNVSFDTNGGSKLASQRVKRNSVITEPAAPAKEGFDFAGWYADKELKTKYDFSAKVTKSITLYAAWTEKDNSINQIILTIGEKAAQVFGQIKTNDVAPKIVNDRTMLPARFVAENLGADVSWDGEKELVTIKGKNLKTSEDVTILIYIGSDIAYVNGRKIKLDSAAFVENDRTYTPIRFISEELGASVEWIETVQKVVITK